jgi:hypothetical protein
MGWSCSAKASFFMEALSQVSGLPSSNEISNAKGEAIGFYEQSSREHADGAITGSVWKYVDAEKRVRKAGSFRIDGDGSVDRFPLVPLAQILEAKKIAGERYARAYGG